MSAQAQAQAQREMRDEVAAMLAAQKNNKTKSKPSSGGAKYVSRMAKSAVEAAVAAHQATAASADAVVVGSDKDEKRASTASLSVVDEKKKNARDSASTSVSVAPKTVAAAVAKGAPSPKFVAMTDLAPLQASAVAPAKTAARLNFTTKVAKVKTHRTNPGTGSLREIRRFQKTTNLLMLKAPFQRLCREIAEPMLKGIRFQGPALQALQEGAEIFMTHHNEDMNKAAQHAGRVTIMPKDSTLARVFRAYGFDSAEAIEDQRQTNNKKSFDGLKSRSAKEKSRRAYAKKAEAKKAEAEADAISQPLKKKQKKAPADEEMEGVSDLEDGADDGDDVVVQLASASASASGSDSGPLKYPISAAATNALQVVAEKLAPKEPVASAAVVVPVPSPSVAVAVPVVAMEVTSADSTAVVAPPVVAPPVPVAAAVEVVDMVPAAVAVVDAPKATSPVAVGLKRKSDAPAAPEESVSAVSVAPQVPDSKMEIVVVAPVASPVPVVVPATAAAAKKSRSRKSVAASADAPRRVSARTRNPVKK